MKKTLLLLAAVLSFSAFGQTGTLDWSKVRNTPTSAAGYGILLPNKGFPCRYTGGTGTAQTCTLGSGLIVNDVTGSVDVSAGGVGTVTSLQCGTGLTGGTITTAGVCAANFGTAAGTIAQGNDARFSDARVPTDNSVTNAKVAAGAAISRSKLALVDDGVPGDPTLRTLGTGPNQAAPGSTSVQKGAITASGLTQATNRLIGRSTAGTGAPEEISLGSNLSMTGGVLNATGGTPTTDASVLTAGTLQPQRLPASGVTPGTYGSSSLVPQITFDQYGRATSATTVAVSGGSGSTPAVFNSPSSNCSADVSSAFNAFMTANGGAAILRTGCYRMDASLVKTSGGNQTSLKAYGDGPVTIYMTNPTVPAVSIDNTGAASAAQAVTSIATVTPPASSGGNPSDDYVDQITLTAAPPSTFVRGAQCVIYSDDMNVGEGSSPIIAMTNTNPVRITLPGALGTSDYDNGDTVRINYATGFTSLNSATAAYTLGNRSVTATSVSFDLVGVDGTLQPAYTGGGYVGGGGGTGDSHGLAAEGFTIHSINAGNKVNIYGRLQYAGRYRTNVQMRCLDDTYKVEISGITFTTRGDANTNTSTATRAPAVLLRGLVNPVVRDSQFEYPFEAAMRTEGSSGGRYFNNVTRYGINNPSLKQYTYGTYFYGVNWNHVVDGYTQQQGRHAITTDAISNANTSAVWYWRGVPHDITAMNIACKTSDGTCIDEHPEGFNLVFKNVDCTRAQKGSITVDSTITGACIQSRSLNPIYENVTVSGGTRGLSITQVDHGFSNKILVDGFTVRDLSSTLTSGGGGEWNDAGVDADSQAFSNSVTTLILRNMKCINVGTCISAGVKNNVIVDGLYTWNTDTIVAAREGSRVDLFGSQIYDFRAKNADGTTTLERSRYGTSSSDANYACAIRGDASYGPGACYWHSQIKLFKETPFAPYAVVYQRSTGGGAVRYYLANGIEENKDAGVATTLLNNGSVVAATDVTVSYAPSTGGGGSISDGDKGDITVSGSGSTWNIDAGAVTNAQMANMAQATFKGRGSGAGAPQDLTATEVTAGLNLFTSSLKGLVPGSGGSSTNFLRGDGVWAAPAGSGGGLADPGANGILARTASGVTAARAIIGTGGISVTNGTGAAGDITISGSGAVAGENKRNRIAFIGDSITAAGKNPGSTTQFYRNARGYMTWLNFYCGQCFETDTSLNFGVGGYSTTDVIAQLSAIVTAAPDVVTVLIGTNDLPGSRTVASITADLNTIYQTLGAAGIKVVAIPILPRAGSAGSDWTGLTTAETTVARNKLNAVNNYIRRYNLSNPTYKIIVAETYKYDVDYASATGDPLTGRRVDGLHPNIPGHERIGWGLFESLQSILPSFSYGQWLTPSDVFDATNNTRGNLLTNGFLAGTGGGVGSGTSGSVAASWGLSRSGSNITAVASKQTLGADGSTAGAQRIVASTTGTSGTGTLETITLTQTISANIAAGDTVVAACNLSGSTLSGNNLVSSQLRLSNAGGTSQNSYGLAGTGLTDLMPTIPYAGLVSTDPLTLPTGVTSVSVRFEIEMDATKTGSVQMDLSRCSLRKIN